MSIFPNFFYLRVSDFLLEYNPETRSLCFNSHSTCIGKLTTKFEIEPAKCDSGLVHIRCGYNGRYWARKSETSYGIGGVADHPEDQTKWSCTLFRLDLDLDRDTNLVTRGVRFFHVHQEKYVTSEGDHQISRELSVVGLISPQTPRTDDDRYIYSNWEELVILPKHVAFKTVTVDHNPWLKAVSRLYMQFASYDYADPQVGNRVSYHPDGSVSIKNDYLRKYWRAATEEDWGWVRVDAKDDSSLYTKFWPVRLGDNSVALRCAANDRYCKRFTLCDVESGVSACISTTTIEAIMEVKELVMLREISNVNFQLSDARIYHQQQLLAVATGHVINGSDEQTQATLKFSYADTKSCTWRSSVSVSAGVEAFMKAVAMPFIVKGRIEFSIAPPFMESEPYKWGSVVKSSAEVETTYNVHVPPKTEMIISLLATKGTCDIPFKYTQRDTLVDGRVVVTQKDDGLYSCTNLYDYTYTTEVAGASVHNITTAHHTTSGPKLEANMDHTTANRELKGCGVWSFARFCG